MCSVEDGWAAGQVWTAAVKLNNITPLIGINWDEEPPGCSENPGNWIFF